MREIKFRALKRNGSEWVYFQVGSLNLDQEDTYSQFTGLKDKNGVDIYEGDILTKGEGMFKIDGYVGYEDGAFGVTTEHNGEVGFIRLGQKTPFTWEEMEVIGNIYENPALLTAPSPDREDV